MSTSNTAEAEPGPGPEQEQEQQEQPELQQQQQQKPPKKPRLKTKLAEAKDYVSERNNGGGGLVNGGGGGREEDLSELVFIKSEPPKPKPATDPNSTDDPEAAPLAAAAAPITFNNTKVYYRCATCGRLVTSMGNRKHKLRLHLRSKYHRLRAKATAEALDTDLVRIVANLRANNVHCLELRGGGGGNMGSNGGDGGDGDEAKDGPTTSSSASGAIKAPIQLYCNICEAELLTRKSSNIRRHLESRATAAAPSSSPSTCPWTRRPFTLNSFSG